MMSVYQQIMTVLVACQARMEQPTQVYLTPPVREALDRELIWASGEHVDHILALAQPGGGGVLVRTHANLSDHPRWMTVYGEHGPLAAQDIEMEE